jgi:hypothetical protein
VYKAVLHFLYQDPSRLTVASVVALVERMLKVAQRDAGVHYRDFRAIVEYGTDTEVIPPFPEREYLLPGRVGWARLKQSDAVLRQKLADERSAHKRVRGHVSRKPEAHLTSETCALIIGSRRFLFKNARLLLEETGVLREKAFDLGEVICGLVSAAEDLRADNYVQANLWEREFYPGNFDALAELVFKSVLTGDEMLERIGHRPLG